MSWTTKSFVAVLVLASLTASSRGSAHGKAPLLVLSVTDAAPSTLVKGKSGGLLVRGKNFSGQGSLSVRVGKLTATSVTVIGDDLLSAEVNVPADEPAGVQSLAVVGPDENIGVLPESIAIVLPPPDPGPGPINAIREIMNVAHDSIVDSGIDFMGQMNQTKNRKDADAVFSEMSTFLSQAVSSTSALLEPFRALGMNLEVDRAMRLISAAAGDFIAAGTLFSTAGNKGPNPRAVHSGDSEILFAAPGRLFVDNGRGPIELELSGSMLFRVTSGKRASMMSYAWQNILATTEASIGPDYSFPSMRFRARRLVEGSMDWETGESSTQVSFDLTAEGMAEPAIVTGSTQGFTAPLRNMYTSLGMPTSLRALTDAEHFVANYGTVSLPENFPGGAATGHLHMNWKKIPPLPGFPRVR